MSFNAKNLSYDASEPSFLRKLKAEYGGTDSARHARPLARPRKEPTGGDDDDQPTYVVEGTQDTMSKDEYEAMIQGVPEPEVKEHGAVETPDSGNRALRDGIGDAGGVKDDMTKSAEKIAAIGVSNKKRLAKAVGVDDEGEQGHEHDGGEAVSVSTNKKPKAKKGKKIKLSFDDEAAPE